MREPKKPFYFHSFRSIPLLWAKLQIVTFFNENSQCLLLPQGLCISGGGFDNAVYSNGLEVDGLGLST